MNSFLKKNQKIKLFLKKKLKQKSTVLFLFKKLQNLNFVLARIKFRFFKNNKFFFLSKSFNNNFTVFHNKKIYLNQSIKNKLVTTLYLKLSSNLKPIKQSFDNLNKYKFNYNSIIKKNRLIFLKKKKSKKNITFFFTLYNKLVSSFFKKGKRSIWFQYFTNILEMICFSLNYSITTILSKIFIKLYTKVELKKVSSRKRISYIPYFIKLNRSLFLALKWIFLGACKNNTTISLKNKLYIEMIQLITCKTSFSFQKFEENNINSFKNRSNIHFRWQKTR